MWTSFGDRSPAVRCQGCRCGKKRPDVEKQRPSPLALCYSRSSWPRSKEILWEILRWIYRSHQYPATSMYLAESRFDPRCRVPRKCQLRFFDIATGESGRGQ